jgi:HAD superfamily hydrolase (TIGR01509 family)
MAEQDRPGPAAVILDVDGTLIDSNAAHARAYVEAARELEIEMSFEKTLRAIGMGGDKLLPHVLGIEESSEEGKRLTQRKKAIFRDRYLPKLEPTPGARALLQRLRDDAVKLVVASSASEDELGPLLDRAGVHDLIQGKTSSDDAEESKPDPDIVEAALRDAGFPAERVVMLGDTPYDVEAATRAGVRIVAVRSGGWDDDALAGAIAVYDDPADLLAHYDDSPLGRAHGR